MRILAVLLVVAFAGYAEEFSGRVVGVADGDTITVLRDDRKVHVRLHGIDSPEKAQPFGTRARQFTGDFAHGENVTVVVRDLDRYGRTVGEVILPDGKNLNHEVVRAGYAFWYRQYARGDATLDQLEREARQGKRGLWSDSSPMAPWEWRKQDRKPVYRQAGRSERRSERRSFRTAAR